MELPVCCRYNFTYLATYVPPYQKNTTFTPQYFPGDNNGKSDFLKNYAK